MVPGSFSISGSEVLALACGTLTGLAALGVLLLVLVPVLRRKRRPSMAMGFLAVVTSFAVLTLGLALAYRILDRVPIGSVLVEVACFLAGLIVLARRVVAGR